ncbi:MAG TPA: aconitate hydratase AcnA [Burkholderiales bacterium]|nr:aconitate hydratase AcnA [Burkholderiales bacterium]
MIDLQATLRELAVGGATYRYYSLAAASQAAGLDGLARLPFSLRILAENLLRHGKDATELAGRLAALARGERGFEIPFRPARVLLQDLLGVPVMVDFAALREAVAAAGGDPFDVNPAIPVDFVIDHSIIADVAGASDAQRRNVEIEYARNRERFAFLAWCQNAFRNFRVVPPDSGIVHQINVERLARVAWTQRLNGEDLVCPDTLVCNDSHATMVNGIGVLGWGVGGIEAEAAMLGRPLSMRVPEVLGIRVTGELPAGATATDLVLTIAERLRNVGVVGKFVEFHGAGLEALPVADRATIANMAPEYGATCVFFPVDQKCIDYLALTGRDAATVGIAAACMKALGLWRDAGTATPRFDADVELDLAAVERSLAGPRRPQQRVALAKVARGFASELSTLARDARSTCARVPVAGRDYTLGDGDVVIAAITSCTNTSNPANMIAAGLLARNAAARGLTPRPWVKTSFAPGSKAVVEYLRRAGLDTPLEALGFHLVGFGCTTCNGNSGPLAPEIEAAIRTGQLVAAAVLSGNRNFEGRVHPLARAAYLASPALVVAYAIAGRVTLDLEAEPLGIDRRGDSVWLCDVWPSAEDLARTLAACVTPDVYRSSFEGLFEGAPEWQALRGASSALFPWRQDSTFLRRPPFFEGLSREPSRITELGGMRPLAILGDMVTTDHLSPNNTIAPDSVAARYLTERGVAAADFQTYGFRRGNHEMALRGTFASSRLKNAMTPREEGPYTRLEPDGTVMPIFDAAQVYRSRGVPLILIAGREYGAGSSRDWAAKGPALLGVRAVVAESFERIHRSNLVGMGILPLELRGTRREDLQLDGTETFDVAGLDDDLQAQAALSLRVRRSTGSMDQFAVTCRIDTDEELLYYRHGGILPYVYRELVSQI